VFIAKKFDICEILSKNFDIYVKIVSRDAGIFFRHQAELVLRHQMQMSNYFVKFFYNATLLDDLKPSSKHKMFGFGFWSPVCRKRGRFAHIYDDHNQLLNIFVFKNSYPTSIFSRSIQFSLKTFFFNMVNAFKTSQSLR
jgi:hypothetical protein